MMKISQQPGVIQGPVAISYMTYFSMPTFLLQGCHNTCQMKAIQEYLIAHQIEKPIEGRYTSKITIRSLKLHYLEPK